jgi:5S rRNA maturation endonuclease (ribonuclease M5)
VNASEFVALLEGVKRSENGWTAKCPAHDDRHASLSVSEADAGQILVKCHAGEGCSVEAICAALGLNVRDLYPERDTDRNGRRVVATYDYEDEQGALCFQAVRYEPKQFLQRRPDGRGGWVWKLGNTRRVLYRLPRVLEAVKSGQTIYVVEGEKDVHALEAAGEVATCNPMGAGKWRDAYAKVLRGADVVVVQDKDDEGRKHAAKVAASLASIAASVRIVEAAEGKDAADHLDAWCAVSEFVQVGPDDPDNRTKTFDPASLSENDVRDAIRTSTGQPPALARDPDILQRFRADLRLAGVAGEEVLSQIVYLAVTSRVLPWGKSTERPISVIPKGSTSTGKSHATRTTLHFFPSSAWLDLGSMSRKYLFYSDATFEHRFIYVPEWASIKEDDELVALLRVLLSEGRIVHGTVDTDRKAQLIEKDGPTGLIMTTTDAAVDLEMETRCLTIVTDDSTEQTRRVYGVFADLEDELASPVDFAAWHALQEWIADHGATRAVVPFVRALAELMPAGATRLRRDFVTLLCLVRAHAILHQLSREKDASGRVIATLDDYTAVASLVGDLIAEGVEASVPQTIRDTVAGIRALQDEGAEHVSPRALAERLGVGRSATYDRIRRAILKGYLVNEAKKDERGMKLVAGAPLPGAEDFLPSREEIVRASSGHPTGQSFGTTMRPSEGSSGRPVCPVSPLDERPLIGDEMYSLLLADAVQNGHLTDIEAEQQHALHEAVVVARTAVEDEEPEDAGPGGPDHDDWQDELDRHSALWAVAEETGA